MEKLELKENNIDMVVEKLKDFLASRRRLEVFSYYHSYEPNADETFECSNFTARFNKIVTKSDEDVVMGLSLISIKNNTTSIIPIGNIDKIFIYENKIVIRVEDSEYETTTIINC